MPLPEWKYIDWMGWHDQGDGRWMLGINVEQGRVRDTPELRLKSGLRRVVDTFPGVDLTLTPSQSIVLRNIKPEGVQVRQRTVGAEWEAWLADLHCAAPLREGEEDACLSGLHGTPEYCAPEVVIWYWHECEPRAWADLCRTYSSCWK